MFEDFAAEDNPADIFYRAIALAEKNNTYDFVRLFNQLDSDKQKKVIQGICENDSPNCLAKILDGEAGDQSMIDYYLSELANNMPLHYAAKEAQPRIAAFLLEKKGYSPDLRTDFNSMNICLNNALPLNVALYYRSYRVWLMDGWRSPIDQMIILCQSSRYSKTIRVFARNTTEIKHEFLKYLKQGKVFEVGALLATASDLIMSSSSTIDGENGSICFKNIMEMRQFLLAEISRSLDATQLKDLKKTLQLLEIFDRFGDKLLEHMPKWDEDDEDVDDDDECTDQLGNKGVVSLIKDAAKDEKAEIEDYNDEILRFSDTAKTSPDDVKIAWKISKQLRGNVTRKFSTRAYSPSWLEDRSYSPSRLEEKSSRVDVPCPLPIQGRYLALKGARTPRTKCVLPKKPASFTGAAVAKAVRHLRYL